MSFSFWPFIDIRIISLITKGIIPISGCLLLLSIISIYNTVLAAEIKGNIFLPSGSKATSSIGMKNYAISVTAYPLDKQETPVKNTKSIVVSIEKKQFTPSFLTVYRGDTLTFKNNDGVFHEVVLKARDHEYSFMLKNTEGHRTHDYKFPASGDWYLFCKLHTRSFGWIRATDTPYIANLDQPGYFEFTNLPKGRWIIQAMGMDGASTSIETHAFTSPPPVKLVMPVNQNHKHESDKIMVTDNNKMRQFFPVK